jgi:hypothetical protein
MGCLFLRVPLSPIPDPGGCDSTLVDGERYLNPGLAMSPTNLIPALHTLSNITRSHVTKALIHQYTVEKIVLKRIYGHDRQANTRRIYVCENASK